MATAQSVIDEARYDLLDYDSGIKWKDEELLLYLNRAVRIINSELCAKNSDLVHGREASIDTVASQAYMDITSMNSGDWDSIRSVWIGQDQLEQITVDRLWYKAKFYDSSATEQPQFWALESQYIRFPVKADDDHTDVVIHYNTKQADLALTDSMPYNDMYNDVIRDALVEQAIARKGDRSERLDKKWIMMCKQAVAAETVRRSFVPKPYHLDF